MEFNRNQYFMVGLVVLLFGLQFRMVESFVLNERASRFLSERNWSGGSNDGLRPVLAAVGPTPHKTLHPPDWMGFAVISVGSVLILHSLAMKRPGG